MPALQDHQRAPRAAVRVQAVNLLPYIVAGSLALAIGSYFYGEHRGELAAAAAYAEAAEIQRRDVRRAEQQAAEATERLAQAREALSAAERRARRQGGSTALTEAQAGGLGDVLRGE